MIQAKEIPLFKDLIQYETGEIIYDFHNDYDCIKICLENKTLTFTYKNHSNNSVLLMKFAEVEIDRFEFLNESDNQPLILDNFYRGRFEKDNELLEFSNDGKACFYVEFGEDVEFQFLSTGFFIDSLQK